MAVTRRPGVLALAVAVLLVGCQDDEPLSDGVTVPDEVAGTADTVTYQPADGSYTLQLPSAWEFDEAGGSMTASPPDQETPALRASVVTIEEPLDDYLDELFAEHPDAQVSTVAAPGATDARLVQRNFDDGGLQALLASMTPSRAVAVIVVWDDTDEFDPQAARSILDTLELHGDSEQASPEAAAPSADPAALGRTHTEEA